MDVLFSHPNDEGSESELLKEILKQLKARGFVLWSQITRDIKPGSEENHDDKLEFCMIIFKYPLDGNMYQDLNEGPNLSSDGTGTVMRAINANNHEI